MAYDSQNQRMFMIGGWRNDLGGVGTTVDVWSLDLMAATPSWTPITPAGTAPSGRALASLVHDATDERLILYGGEDQTARYADAWSLSLTGTPTWTPLSPTGAPPPGRSRHGAIYDPVRDQVVVFGGSTTVSPNLENDVWALSLTGSPAWSQLSPAGTAPSRRRGMTVALDAPRDRMIVFGGLADASPVPAQDVWALDLAGCATWDSIEVAAGPAPRRAHTAVVDPLRSRLLVFGGYTDAVGDSLASNDLWALTLSGTPIWNALRPADSPPKPDAEHSAIYHLGGNRMILYGGVGTPNSIWIYQSDAVLAAPSPAGPMASSKIRATPNPSRGSVDLSFALPAEGRAQVTVYDVSGRRIARLVDTTPPAGAHEAR